jgi:hypothetical protein
MANIARWDFRRGDVCIRRPRRSQARRLATSKVTVTPTVLRRRYAMVHCAKLLASRDAPRYATIQIELTAIRQFPRERKNGRAALDRQLGAGVGITCRKRGITLTSHRYRCPNSHWPISTAMASPISHALLLERLNQSVEQDAIKAAVAKAAALLVMLEEGVHGSPGVGECQKLTVWMPSADHAIGGLRRQQTGASTRSTSLSPPSGGGTRYRWFRGISRAEPLAS